MVCLQEIKMEAFSQVSVPQMLGPDFSRFVFLPSAGASGGILIAWKESVGFTGLSRVDNHLIFVQFCPAGGSGWWLTCVYGLQSNEAKIQFLHELR